MSGKRSPVSSWCILRDDTEIRDLLQYRMNKKGYTTLHIQKAIGIENGRLSKYFRYIKPNMTQYEFVRLAKYLGVELTVNIKIIE
jgi:hypothetical protein